MREYFPPSHFSKLDGPSNKHSTGKDFIFPWKRPLDWLVILVTSPLWLPVSLMCALWIGLSSKGGVLFRQQRVGYGGKIFTIYKFRTMVADADTDVYDQHFHGLITSERPMTKLDMSDPRLIPGALFMRAVGLDELPQLLNVMRGEMSIVGPRPCLPSEMLKYKSSYLKRFNGLPGLTGNWQVNGKNKTTFRKMIALDICYLRNASLKLDLLIILRTFPTLFGLFRELGRNQRHKSVRREPVIGRTLPLRTMQVDRKSTQIIHRG